MSGQTGRGRVGEAGYWVRNMSAPPRSQISFRPYGLGTPESGAGDGAPGPVTAADRTQATGLRHILRVDLDDMLNIPEVSGNYPHLDRLVLIRLLAHAEALIDCQPTPGLAELAFDESERVLSLARNRVPPNECLRDRLADLASSLPPPPALLPALALVETDGSLLAGSPTHCEPLAMLWVVTHINGNTFDRNGRPILAHKLGQRSRFDLYAP